MAPYPGYLRSNTRANTPDIESTLFVINLSWRITLPASPGLSRRRKDTLLYNTRTLGAPLSRQVLFGMKGKVKPITNDSCIEYGQNISPGGTYTTKSAILNSSLPHTVIINLGKINTCKPLGRLCSASPNFLNTKSSTEGAGDH